MKGRVRTAAITADPETPVTEAADNLVVLDFADERSVVRTRCSTSAFTLLRAHLGLPTDAVVADTRPALSTPLPPGLVECAQVTFLGRGWTAGLASEAGLKTREASLSWTEAHPAMEYRHGPVERLSAAVPFRSSCTAPPGSRTRVWPPRWPRASPRSTSAPRSTWR